MENNNDFDFVAIGDVTTDTFIKLSDADVHMDKEKHREELCISFGDKIEYDFLKVVPAVGNCANASVAAARLGLSSALLTNQGNDDIAEKNTKALIENGVSTKLVKSWPNRESNHHFVMWFQAERTILVKHYEYPYSLEGIGKPRFIYVTSLGKTSLPFHDEIADYLEANPDVKMALQPGTFQMEIGYEKTKRLYKAAELFFCNVQEAQRIMNSRESEPIKLAEQMHELGPQIAIITDGPKGAFVYDGHNKEGWFMPIYPDPKPPYERTGAGDAFSSTFAIAIDKGYDLQTAMLWAPISSMSVVQKIGAQEGLPTEEEIKEYLAKAPADYKPRKI